MRLMFTDIDEIRSEQEHPIRKEIYDFFTNDFESSNGEN